MNVGIPLTILTFTLVNLSITAAKPTSRQKTCKHHYISMLGFPPVWVLWAYWSWVRCVGGWFALLLSLRLVGLGCWLGCFAGWFALLVGLIRWLDCFAGWFA